MNSINYPPAFPQIREQDVYKENQPYFFTFRPALPIAAGAVVPVQKIMSDRDFIWTHIGWRTSAVAIPAPGWPAIGQDFRINIRDITASKKFGDERFDLKSITGSDPEWHDQGMFKLVVPWRFTLKTTVEVEMENAGGVPCLLTVTLHGYYTNSL